MTIIHRGRALLPILESFVGEQVLVGLRADGIDVRLEAVADRVDRSESGGEVPVHLEDGTSIVGDELLVATGRQPVRTTSAWTLSAFSQAPT